MRIFRSYWSKKYLRRIIISFSILVLLSVSLFSLIIYFNAESVILRVQNDSNKKILAQINFNISYLNSVLPKLMSALYYDANVVFLMAKREDADPLDALISRSRIDKIAGYTPFIQSIVVYNGNLDRFYWGGDSALQDKDAPIYAEYRKMFQSAQLPKLEMVPMSLDAAGGKVDFYSIFNYDSVQYRPGSSVFILNIKTEWLFDNIKLINDLTSQDNEKLFIVGKDGAILSSGNEAAPEAALYEAAFRAKLMASEAARGTFSFEQGKRKMIASFLRVGTNGWTLVSMMPYETLVKNAAVLKTTSISMTVVFILLSLLATLGIAHRLYRPLGRLLHAMRQNASVPIEPQLAQTDELSYMSTIYQQTIKHLTAVRSEQNTVRNIVRSYYVRLLVTDSLTTSREQAETWIVQHRLKLHATGSFVLGVMKLDGDSASDQDDKDRKLLHFALFNISDEMLSRYFQCELAELKNEHILVVLSLPPDTDGSVEPIKSVFRTIQLEFSRLYRMTFSVSLTEEVREYTALSHHYALALQALRYTLVFGNQAIITPVMIHANQSNPETGLPPDLEKRLLESIRSNQDDMFTKTLHAIFDYVATLSYDYMVYIVLHVFIVMKSAVKEINDNRIVPLSVDLAEFNQQILDSRSLTAMKEVLLDLYRKITANKKSPETEKNEVLIETIKEIIGKHYHDVTLNLQKICDMMKLSPDYIGKLFKKHQGISVAEYINEVRLRHAVHLLETGDHSINELIERIGFTTPSSFFRLFKNKYGTTPKEYRIKRNISE